MSEQRSDGLSQTESVRQGRAAGVARDRSRRWTRHALHNGLIFGATYHGVRHLPRSVSYGLGHAGTWLAWRYMRRGTEPLLENLRAAFPGTEERELRALALCTYRSYARDVVDFIRGLEMTREKLASEVSRIDRESFDRLLAEGRGILLVTGHFGNWEMGGVLLRRLLGYPLTVVVMAEPSPLVNRMRRQFRESVGAETLEVRGSMDTALHIRRALSENRIVAMLLDRSVGRDRVEVSFLGRPTPFLRTPALLAYLTGAPLLPSFVIRDGDGRLAGVSGAPIRLSRERDRDLEVARATQEFASELERRIRTSPHLWYQFYDYWGARDE